MQDMDIRKALAGLSVDEIEHAAERYALKIKQLRMWITLYGTSEDEE